MRRKSTLFLMAVSAVLSVLSFIPVLVEMTKDLPCWVNLSTWYIITSVATLGLCILSLVFGNTNMRLRKFAFVLVSPFIVQMIAVYVSIVS